MRESIGATSIFIIVVVLIVTFTSVVSYTTNRNNAIAAKDEIVTIIEKYHDGSKMNNNSNITSNIKDVLIRYGSRKKNKCSNYVNDVPAATYGFAYDGSIGSSNAATCVYQYQYKDNNEDLSVPQYYYKVYVFYSVSLPIVGDLFTFKSVGETIPMFY